VLNNGMVLMAGGANPSVYLASAVEFQRASGMTGYRQPASLRVQVFLCGAILGRAGHRTVRHLSAAWGGLERRNSLFDKLLLYEVPTSRKLEITTQPAG
jgi:hypothetical protein